MRRTYRMNRHVAVPLEGRAVLAYRDHRLDELVVYTSTQMPHIIRLGLSEVLGLEERNIRVIAPDVGGGFGSKARLSPEEIVGGRARARSRSSRALGRGPRRASPGLRPHPRPPLPRHRLCRPARTRARHRCRADRRWRRLCDVAARAVPGNRDGGAQSSGAVQHPQLSCEDLHRRHQQDRRSVPIAASAARAPASRSSAPSTRWRARSAATRPRCAWTTWSPRRRCRTPRSPTCNSTTATTRPRSSSAPRRSISPPSARGSSGASPTAG